MPPRYTLIEAVPTVAVYRALRVGAGLSAKTEEAAAKGLPQSCFAVQVLCDGEPVGMGRVIGDGGCFYQVVDIAVLPAHQDRAWVNASWPRSLTTCACRCRPVPMSV